MPARKPERPARIGADLAQPRDLDLLAEALPDHQVRAVSGPQEADALDLLVLDARRLPGWQTCLQAWRKRVRSYVPVLALLPPQLSRAEDLERVWPLVDDWQYLPVRPPEFRARIFALLRMAQFSRQQQHKMHALLAHSERRFREVAELLAEYSYALRFDDEAPGGLALEWAGGDLRRLGLDPAKASGGWWTLLTPAAAADCDEQYALARAGTQSVREFQLSLSGAQRWVSHHVAPLVEEGAIVGIFAAVRDIDSQRRTLDELRLLSLAAASSPSMVLLWQSGDPSPRLVNPSAAPLLVKRDAIPQLYEQAEALHAGQSRKMLVALDGGQTVEITLSRSPGLPGQPDTLLAAGRDISEQLRQERALAHAASHDALTGLPERALFSALCAHQLAQTGSVALVLFDFGNLKTVNESLGHEAGDTALNLALDFVKQRLPADSVLARVGGNEFGLLLAHDGEADDLASYLETLRLALEAPLRVGDQEVVLHASVGVALAPQDGTDPAVLLRHAESALRGAREAGGRRVAFFRHEMNTAARRRLALDAELRRAFDQGEFRLHYQLQWPTRAGLPFGAEALLRWQHPVRGLLAPAAFLDVLEDMALIHALGLWVIEQACRQWHRWREQGVEPPNIAVNVAAAQLGEPGFADAVAAVISTSGVPPAAIELEVTESQVMRDLDLTRKLLARLHGAGQRLALDDFGTGHSALAYLAELPFDRLKIDQQFVRGLPESAKAAELVRTILLMAGGLELKVIAEGVETEAQADFLRRAGCHWLQGFGLAHPCPPEEIAALLSRGRAWLARHAV